MRWLTYMFERNVRARMIVYLSSLQVPQVVCDLHGWGQETPTQKVTAWTSCICRGEKSNRRILPQDGEHTSAPDCFTNYILSWIPRPFPPLFFGQHNIQNGRRKLYLHLIHVMYSIISLFHSQAFLQLYINRSHIERFQSRMYTYMTQKACQFRDLFRACRGLVLLLNGSCGISIVTPKALCTICWHNFEHKKI